MRVDTSKYPRTMIQAYRLFSNKCGECHTLDLSLNSNFSSAQWQGLIKQMQARPSSNISDQEVKTIARFLDYYDGLRAAPVGPVNPSGPPTESVAVGQRLYSTLNCSLCHSIAGTGGSLGAALDGVGSKLSRLQLIAKLEGKPPSQIMPPLPPGTTSEQINDLVDYLLTLKRH